MAFINQEKFPRNSGKEEESARTILYVVKSIVTIRGVKVIYKGGVEGTIHIKYKGCKSEIDPKGSNKGLNPPLPSSLFKDSLCIYKDSLIIPIVQQIQRNHPDPYSMNLHDFLSYFVFWY